MRYPLPWFPLSEGTSRCSCRTTRGYRPYRSSLLGCRFGRSGSSRFVGGFRPRHWCGCVPVPRVRSCRDRCRYKYTCRPKRIQFSLRGRLKLLRLSDDLCLFFCLRHRSVFPSFFRTVFLEDFGFNQFVEARLNLQFAYY